MGWRVDVKNPLMEKMVVLGYPHTSNWDFFLGLMMMWSLNISPNWIGKHTLFRGPLNWLFRSLGGIPVDRKSPKNIVQQIIDQFKKRKHLILGIAPEGTRAKTDRWKSGFYHIAAGAGVPVALGFLNYPQKTVGIGPSFIPGGNPREDIHLIQNFYADITGKYPENMGKIEVSPKLFQILKHQDPSE